MKDSEVGESLRFRGTFRVGNGYSMRGTMYLAIGIVTASSLLGTTIGTFVYLVLGR